MGNGRVSLVTAIVFVMATVAFTAEKVENRAVVARMQIMNDAWSSVNTLQGMMTGRVLFDRTRASRAKQDLVQSMGTVRTAFKRAHSDQLSHARETIWERWPDFQARTRDAERAARGIDHRTPQRLAKTLPRMLNACLECHQTYRNETDQLGQSYVVKRTWVD